MLKNTCLKLDNGRFYLTKTSNESLQCTREFLHNNQLGVVWTFDTSKSVPDEAPPQMRSPLSSPNIPTIWGPTSQIYIWISEVQTTTPIYPMVCGIS